MTFFFRPWYYDPLFWELFFLDWISKSLAFVFLSRPLTFTHFLSLGISINRGVSLSLFDSGDQCTFLIVSLAVFGVLCFLAKYTLTRQKEGYEVLGETLLLAGGFSNFTDRLMYGGVVDFIRISWGRWAFPVFNIADVIITCGVAIILYNFFFEEEPSK